MTRIVWPRPHSNNTPACRQEGPYTVCPAVFAAWEPGPLKVAGFVAGRHAPSLEGWQGTMRAILFTVLFTVEGKGNFKGIAYVTLIGGMTAGKENGWKAEARMAFPGLPLRIVWPLCVLWSQRCGLCLRLTLN